MTRPMPDELTMQIAQVVPCTEAEGPGKRFAVWFQGCPLRCPGCCNPEFLPFQGGETKTLARDGRVAGRGPGRERASRGSRCSAASRSPTPPAAAALARAARQRGLDGDGLQRVHPRGAPRAARPGRRPSCSPSRTSSWTARTSANSRTRSGGGSARRTSGSTSSPTATVPTTSAGGSGTRWRSGSAAVRSASMVFRRRMR